MRHRIHKDKMISVAFKLLKIPEKQEIGSSTCEKCKERNYQNGTNNLFLKIL